MQDPIEILPYQESHQPGIDAMMADIAKEFSEPMRLPPEQMPAAFFRLPDAYWVALCNGQVVGTVGVAVLEKNYTALRKMFVRKEFRGSVVALPLLKKAVSWARQSGSEILFLGTMEQFKAAQRFYEKNNFEQIPRSEIPHDFPLNPVDTVFYKLKLIDNKVKH